MIEPMSKFCWTCGAEKDVRDYPHDPDQFDGLSAECQRCADMRALARRMDGCTGPRTRPIEGEGRRRAPRNATASARAAALSFALRRRPSSGLVATDI